MKQFTWFTALAFSFVTHSAELTLYAIPSPHGINWESPLRLLFSAALNEYAPDGDLLPHSIGHVNVELTCDEPAYYFLSGMTFADSLSKSAKQLLFNDKAGLGVLFHTFEGKLQDEAQVSADLKARAKSSEMRLIRFKISEKTCDRLKNYVQEYRSSGDDGRYGLALKPRRHEGAGCSAFAVSFLELAGLLGDEYSSAWSKTILIPATLLPHRYSFHPLSPERVGFLNFFAFWRTHRWAEPHEPHLKLFFWDPDAMFRDLGRRFEDAALGQKPGVKPAALGRAQGIEIDARKIPTPTDSIWQ